LVNSTDAQHCASTILRNVIETAEISGANIVIDDKAIQSNASLISFYDKNQFELAWCEERNVIELVDAVRNAGDEGLNPDDYHIRAIEKYFKRKDPTEIEKVTLDLLLTDAFLIYSSHLLTGKLDPELLYSEKWEEQRRALDLVQLLISALHGFNVGATLEGLKPAYEGYAKLKAQLKFFRKLQREGGWQPIAVGEPIEPGTVDDRIPLIRKRLSLTSQLHSLISNNDSDFYDSAMISVVKKIQYQHGLNADGIIGQRTINVINYQPDDYINRIVINLERYRWLPWELEDRYVLINIPDFQLEVRESDSLIMKMKTIIGRPDRRTPQFSSHIRYLIINPTWIVPPTILKEDVLPAVKTNIRYLEKNNIRVIDKTGQEIDPSALPWSTFTERNFPYQLRQDPGLYNSMGLIKFQFPNQHKVFLHDTNNHSLFSKEDRALSSGCIRIERPFVLAAHMLKNTKWTLSKLNKVVESGKTMTIVFPEPFPIHIVYFTAFVDSDNSFQVRSDIYELDAAILNNLLPHSIGQAGKSQENVKY
jgi:murein L,D-transpeptidase YcbB/YkuD